MTAVQVPELDHDAMMLSRFGQRVEPNGKLERRIVANLISHLAAHGFKTAYTFDGDEYRRCRDMKAAMELVFNLDEVSLRFRKPKGATHGVLLVLGNGVDIVSDWNYLNGDPDGFNAAMNAFDAKQYA